MPIIALYSNGGNKRMQNNGFFKTSTAPKLLLHPKCCVFFQLHYPSLKLQPQKNHQAILLNTKSEGNLS